MSKKNKHSRWTTQPAAHAAVASQPQPVVGPISTTPPGAESKSAEDFNPITPAQLLANRANAQLSTGPRTTIGKSISSKNAVKSGLTGRTVLLPTDDAVEYASFLNDFQLDLAPATAVECELVQSIADTVWRLRRIRALEFALYTQGHLQFEEAFDDYPEEVRYNMILLQTHMTYEKQFRNYNIQEARLDRRREKDMNELRRLQAERRQQQTDNEASALDDPGAAEAAEAAAITALARARYAEYLQSCGSTALPENGFDFSNTATSPSQAPVASEMNG